MVPLADTGLVALLYEIGRYVALPAALGILLLVPLYLSQRRDVSRLRGWMERDPDHPRADVAASEALLDRADAELAEFLADGGEPAAGAAAASAARPAAAARAAGEEGPATVEVPAAGGAGAPGDGGTPPGGTPVTPIPAARQVTAERPALT